MLKPSTQCDISNLLGEIQQRLPESPMARSGSWELAPETPISLKYPLGYLPPWDYKAIRGKQIMARSQDPCRHDQGLASASKIQRFLFTLTPNFLGVINTQEKHQKISKPEFQEVALQGISILGWGSTGFSPWLLNLFLLFLVVTSFCSFLAALAGCCATGNIKYRGWYMRS